MLKVENIEVNGWEAAIRGMRNPMNSHAKSDTEYFTNYYDLSEDKLYLFYADIGDNDLELMQKLVKAGSDHAKFMRFINVTMDITAPLYWWKQADQYKIGTVTNSTSTMYKIHDKEFTLDDFSCDKLLNSNDSSGELILELDRDDFSHTPKELLLFLIEHLNYYCKYFIETKNKIWWYQIIQLLPSSYNQMRTVQLNYEVLRRMYFARKNHKLDEWREFCQIMIDELPYFAELIGEEKED